MSRSNTDKRVEWKAQGLCIQCGTKPALPNRTKCKECRDRIDNRRHERRAKKLCKVCGEPVYLDFTLCQKHLELQRERKAEYKSKIDPNKRLDTSLKRRYHISLQEYNELFDLQDGVCYICKKAETRTINGTLCRLSVDHDERTGKVRGLLCSKCNTAIGLLKEDSLVIVRVLPYLYQNSRPDRHQFFMQMAYLVSIRATCPRASVGSVLVRQNRLISTGYNGAPFDSPHCFDAGCIIENNHCIRAVHSEVNTVLVAARFGITTDKTTLYTTHQPCMGCSQVLVSAGVERVVYAKDYGEDSGIELLRNEGIQVWNYKELQLEKV